MVCTADGARITICDAATRIITRNQVVQEVGGKEDYDEAMRYIEIKDIIDEKYIEPVDRKSMGYSAAIAMVSGLGDAWSSFLTDDEYKTYQLSSSNEYADIGMSLVKDSSGGFQVVTVYPDSPAARSGVVRISPPMRSAHSFAPR